MPEEIEILSVKTTGNRVSVQYKFDYGKCGTLHIAGPITRGDVEKHLRGLYERNNPQNLAWTAGIKELEGKKLKAAK